MKKSNVAGSATLHKRMFAFGGLFGAFFAAGIEPVTGFALALIVTQYLASL